MIKDREALAALDPFADTMLLTTLHWPDEIRSTKDLDLPEEEPDFKPAELAMAKQLVSAMTGEFEPEKYHDEYREALMKVIEAKIEGHEAVVPEPVEETGNLIDLMAALEASVKATKAAREATRRCRSPMRRRHGPADQPKPTRSRRRRKPRRADRARPATPTKPRSRPPRQVGEAAVARAPRPRRMTIAGASRA